MAQKQTQPLTPTSISQPKPDQAPAPKKATTTPPPNQERQSQLATILIGLLIIASGLLVYNYFQTATAPATTKVSDSGQTSSTNTSANTPKPNPSPTPSEVAAAGSGSYTVMPGDTLWSIAAKVYGDGHKWSKIDQANDIARNQTGQPDVEIGQVLKVPDSAASTIAGSQSSNPTNVSQYTVVRGDSLWSISERFYGSGTDWTKIYDDPRNRIGLLPNGRPLIHAGNHLYLPT